MNRAINNDYDLRRYFEEYGRGEQFSPYGFKALFEYLEQYEEETGDSLTVDPVGLSCDFTEYDSAKEALEELHNLATRHMTEARALELLEDEYSYIIKVADYIETAGDRVIIQE